MKIISKHPEIYLRYRNKKIYYVSMKGEVVGYYFIEKEMFLIAETNLNSYHNMKMFLNISKNISLQDYHGNENKYFFLVYKEDIEFGIVKVDQ